MWKPGQPSHTSLTKDQDGTLVLEPKKVKEQRFFSCGRSTTQVLSKFRWNYTQRDDLQYWSGIPREKPSKRCKPVVHLAVVSPKNCLRRRLIMRTQGSRFHHGLCGMVVMDEDTCIVDVARYFLEFLQDESCGKCLSCREGTKQMAEIITDITKGKERRRH